MVKLSSTGLVVAVAGLALSLGTSTGVASADPDYGPLLNSTCTYPQAVAALNAQSPDAAQQFAASPLAQTWLRNFLGAGAAQRSKMLQQVGGMPGAQQFEGVALQVANSCMNY
jgi:hemophore-related protein